MQNNKTKIEKALECHQNKDLVNAELGYLDVLKENPNDLNALNLLGFLKIQTEKYDESIHYLAKASELAPKFFDAWFNLGLAYKNKKELAQSAEAYQNALSLQPNHAETYFNLAGVFDLLNDTETATEYYKKAYEYNKEKSDNEIKYLIGISSLKIKNFEEGLKFYEYRLSKDFAIYTEAQSFGEKFTSKPYWEGEDIKNKTIFVYYESGLGDTILYFRYISLLKDKCKKIIFRPQMCFTDILKENNWGAEIIDGKTKPEDLNFDVHSSIMSLPLLLKQFSEKAPLAEGYLKANPQITKSYKEKYFNNDKMKIGIKWKGNTAYDLNRVIKLESFYRLFEIPNTQFYSVQKGEGIDEINNVPAKYNLIDIGETFNNFNDTAAAIENMDLVICNDTSVAHLAGAMGKPCWILLPFVQNWRWYNDLSYSPWYNSVKLFKQNEPGNWDEVFDKVKEGLLKK